jgi:hypothetical protein
MPTHSIRDETLQLFFLELSRVIVLAIKQDVTSEAIAAHVMPGAVELSSSSGVRLRLELPRSTILDRRNSSRQCTR